MFQLTRSRGVIQAYSSFIRYNSTTAKQYVRKRPTFRDLIKAPVFKTLILTLFFASASLDLVKHRKELETLTGSYTRKFTVLEELIKKLENNETVDIAKELQLANAFTKHKYNSVTDIELDEQLETFLKMADEPPVLETEEEGRDIPGIEQDVSQDKPGKKPSSGDFL